MKKLTTRIPDVPTLRLRLRGVVRSSLTNFLQSTHSRKEEVVGSLRFGVLASIFLICISIFLFLSGVDFETLSGRIILMVALLWTVVLLLSGRGWFVHSKLLSQEMNMALAPIMTTTLDEMCMFTHSEDFVEQTAKVLADARLLSATSASVHSQDRYYIYREEILTFYDLSADVDNSREFFQGVLGVIPLVDVPEDFQMYVSVGVGSATFSNKTYQEHMQKQPGITTFDIPAQSTTTPVQVCTTDVGLAKQILTPTFVDFLHECTEKEKKNIRISIRNRKFSVVFPLASIVVGTVLPSTKSAAVERYAQRALTPVWQALSLHEHARTALGKSD